MTSRAFWWGGLWVTCVSLALSTRSDVYWLPVLILGMCFLYALFTMILSRACLTVRARADAAQIKRGADSGLSIAAHMPFWPPGMEVKLFLSLPGDSQGIDGGENCCTLRTNNHSGHVAFTAPHVGITYAGVQRVEVRDAFELFCARRKPSAGMSCALTVLPNTFDTWPMAFPRNDLAIRTTPREDEELTAPSDTRAWRPGDPMKRIHWKLSARKRELLVRRFEEPRPNDTLVLCDCALPAGAGVRAAYYRDALLETTLSVALLQMHAGNPVRVPLRFADQPEFSSESGMQESALASALCAADFDRAEAFDRTLLLETRRAMRVGAVCAVTACLTPRVVDALCVMRAAGPGVRLLLVTYTPEDGALMKPVARLLHHGVEVCPVLPIAPSEPSGGGGAWAV